MRRKNLPLLITTAICGLLYSIGGIAFGWFSKPVVLVNLFTDNAFLGVAAIGLTLVILSGGIDLSVGAVIGCVSISSALLIEQYQWSPSVVVFLMLMGGLLFGGAMGCLIHFFELQPFLVTLAGLFFCRGLGLVLSQESVSITHPVVEQAGAWSMPAEAEVSFKVVSIIFLCVLGLGLALSWWSRFGRNIYALGGSEASALLMGLPIGVTKVGVYALSGFCSALAGVVYTIYTSSGNATAASGLELDAIAAVVVGGTLLSGGVGHLAGTLMGVLILGIIQTLITFQGTLSSWWTRIVIGVLLLGFILLQRLLQKSNAKAG